MSGPREKESEMMADYQWFSGFGYPDIKNMPFIRCYPVNINKDDGKTGLFDPGDKDEDAREERTLGGCFLINESPRFFSTFRIDLEHAELNKTATNEDAWIFKTEPADLRARMKYELRKFHENNRDPRFFTCGLNLETRAHYFTFGWMCARKGLDDLSARFYAIARSFSKTMMGHERWSFRQLVESELGDFELSKVVSGFGDPRIKRPELLARLRRVSERFSHAQCLDDVKNLSNELERMIAEDSAHPARTEDEIAKLSPAEQVKEWLFRLRDQNGRQFMSPGEADVFFTERFGLTGEDQSSAAHRLLQLADIAVPALISTLNDSRPTRTVGIMRGRASGRDITTIGKAALQILDRIADRSFEQNCQIDGDTPQAVKAEKINHVVQTWWSNRQSKGMVAELSDVTALGVVNSVRTGEKLLKDFPHEAAAPILTGATNAKDSSTRGNMIDLVARLEDTRAADFLLREVRAGPFTFTRAEAGHELAKLGHLEGINVLAELWRSSARATNCDDGRKYLIHVLAEANSPEAILALADGLRKRSPAVRSMVMEAMALRDYFDVNMHGDYVLRCSFRPAGMLKPSSETWVAMEALLASEIDDTDYFKSASSFDGHHRIDPNLIGDEATALLAARWPDRYSFNMGASYAEREKQRAICMNVWRKSLRQQPLPLPSERGKIAPGEESQIAEVVLKHGGIKWPATIQPLLMAAQGRRLDPKLFGKLERAYLDACAENPPSGDLGFFVDVFRENTSDGVTVVAGPVERRALYLIPKRNWRLG